MSGKNLFDTHIVVDWSARSKPSSIKPTKDAIFWCTVRDGLVLEPEYARTRHDAKERLIDLLLAEKAAGRRVLIGFDFPFGYPAGVAKHLTGKASALALWGWLDARIEDQADNANNRFAVASEINRAYPGIGPAWGRPALWRFPDVPTGGKVRVGEHPSERRIVERRSKNTKSVWQLHYNGSVGSQTLVGLPALKGIREEVGASVWPFDTGLKAPESGLVLAEIYPSLLSKQVSERQLENEVLDAAQVRVLSGAFSSLDKAGNLAPLFAPDLSAEHRHTVETEEAWIFGVGFEDALRAAA